MRIIKRIFLWILAGLGALLLFLVLSTAFDYAVGSGRLGKITNTAIPGVDGAPDVRAYVARPTGAGPFPVVIMIHEFFGLNESITGKADGLAQAGYMVVAPDTFRGSTTGWIPRAILQVLTSKTENINADLDSVYAWLEQQPDVDKTRIGITGFCFGGRTALLYSLHNDRLAASVVFYGSPVTDPEVLKYLPGPLLGIFGGADPSIPAETVKAFDRALTEAGVKHEISVYPGQPHAFVQDMAGIRAGGAQGQAWDEMLKFLDTNLKHTGSSRAVGGLAYDPGFDWRYYFMLAFEHALGSAGHIRP